MASIEKELKDDYRRKKRRAITRRRFIRNAGIAGLGFGLASAAGAGGYFLLREDQEQEPQTIEKQIKKLEAGYTRDDLEDAAIRQSHLQMVSQFFYEQSGRKRLTPENLVSSVHFLNSAEFAQTMEKTPFPADSSEYGRTMTDGTIFVRTDGPQFQEENIALSRKVVPSFTALSVARQIVTHEYFHKTAILKPVDAALGIGDQRYHLIGINGFDLLFATEEQNLSNDYASKGVLDEGTIMFLTAELNKAIDGVSTTAAYNEEGVTNVVARLYGLKQARPNVISALNELHQNSDFFGFARAVARESGWQFNSDQESLTFGVNIIGEMANPIGNSPLYDEYIGYIPYGPIAITP